MLFARPSDERRDAEHRRAHADASFRTEPPPDDRRVERGREDGCRHDREGRVGLPKKVSWNVDEKIRIVGERKRRPMTAKVTSPTIGEGV